MTDSQCLAKAFQYCLDAATKPYGKAIVVMADDPFHAYWTQHIPEMGSPVGPQIKSDDGNIYWPCVTGVWRMLNDGAGTVELWKP